MGTSTPNTGPTGGSWSVVRRNATRFARTRDSKYVERALRAYAQGSGDGVGGGGAGGSSASAVAGAQRLGGFLSALSAEGLDAALRKFDLGEHVGQDRWGVLQAIQSFLTKGFEDQHVEQAFIDVLDALYGDEPQTYEEMQDVGVTPEEVENFLELMIAQSIFNGVVPTLHETLAREDPENVDELEAQFRDYIQTVVEISLDGAKATDIDWLGPAGRAIIERARADAENILRGNS
jgi:hypothetical protein